MKKNILPPYSVEQLQEMAGKYVGQFHDLHSHDREEAEAIFIAGAVEALSRFDRAKANGGGARGYQMAYAMGGVKNYFRARSEACGAENVSLDKTVKVGSGEGSDKETLADTVEGKPLTEAAEQKEMREAIAKAVADLPEQQSAVISAIYWRGLNQTEIGKELGISATRVSQIVKDAEESLRYKLAAFADVAA